MSPDHVLSLVYCAFCALLLLTLIGIIFKILSKEKDSRDMYSIFTFLFMIMMLSIRTATIYPIVANNENFNDYESKCSETIFAGIPLSFFSLSILIHTFRWIMLKIKLSSGKSHSKVSAIFIISTVAISFGKHIFGVCLLCTDNKLI